jgi:hypothetical protein
MGSGVLFAGVLLLGGLGLTGLDKYLDAVAVQLVTAWVFTL